MKMKMFKLLILFTTMLIGYACNPMGEQELVSNEDVPVTASAEPTSTPTPTPTPVPNFKAFQLGTTLANAISGQADGDEYVIDTLADASGNIYVSFSTGSNLIETLAGKNDIVLAKLDIYGAIVWITQLGPSNGLGSGDPAEGEYCRALSLDGNGFLYCGGETHGNTSEANTNTRADIFMMKFDALTGTRIWDKQWGAVTAAPAGVTTLNDFCNGGTYYKDKVYCLGESSSTFGEVKEGTYDPLIIAMNLDGTVDWIKQLGSVSKPPGANGISRNYCYSLLIVDDMMYLGCETRSDYFEVNGGNSKYDVLMLKLNVADGSFVAGKHFGAVTLAKGGGDNSQNESACKNLTMDSDGNLLCFVSTTGSFVGALGGANDGVVLKMDTSFNIIWATQLGAATTAAGGDNLGADYPFALSVDSNNDAYLIMATDGAVGETNGGVFDTVIVKLSGADGSIIKAKQFGAFSNTGNDTNTQMDYVTHSEIVGDQLILFGTGQGSLFDTNAGLMDIYAFKVSLDTLEISP